MDHVKPYCKDTEPLYHSLMNSLDDDDDERFI